MPVCPENDEHGKFATLLEDTVCACVARHQKISVYARFVAHWRQACQTLQRSKEFEVNGPRDRTEHQGA